MKAAYAIRALLAVPLVVIGMTAAHAAPVDPTEDCGWISNTAAFAALERNEGHPEPVVIASYAEVAHDRGVSEYAIGAASELIHVVFTSRKLAHLDSERVRIMLENDCLALHPEQQRQRGAK